MLSMLFTVSETQLPIDTPLPCSVLVLNMVKNQSGVENLVKNCLTFVGFGSLKMKLLSLFGDISLLNVCKSNTKYPIKFSKCSEKKLLPDVHQKMFLNT